MKSDFEIGRVVAIDTSQVTIELNPDLKAMTRSTYETTTEVGRINSYVIIPIGARRIVAMVTRVVMTEEAELRIDKTMVSLPSALRLMKATMIGTIDDKKFNQGISLFPVLDTPVLVATKDDLEAIFGVKKSDANGPGAEEPGYCITIGKSVVFPDYNVKINPDVFFGKHAAVIGSTGSGKSCSIATLIQSIFDCPEVKNTTIIILDTNGEFRTAFQSQNANKDWKDVNEKFRCLYIPTDPNKINEKLIIPYWFMDSNDFIRLFRASPGIQRPILLDALRSARAPHIPGGELIISRDFMLQELHEILGLGSGSGRVSTNIRDLADGLKSTLEKDELIIKAIPEEQRNKIIKALEEISSSTIPYIGTNNFANPIPANVKRLIDTKLTPIITELASHEEKYEISKVTADNPAYFSKDDFVYKGLETAMRRDEAGGARARDYCATMLMRIYRLLEDNRFEFLFGPFQREYPKPLHSLATFLRDLLGLFSGTSKLSPKEEVEEGTFPFYDRQRASVKMLHNIIVIDLSLLASEVLENVTALIGRLILEFLQRVSETELSGINRGEFPVVLVLEEAQNYIHVSRGQDDESISREVFERIAREGRKFGLSLVVASQRPSELSKTVLSQCNSFIVHRLQNPEDLQYFREIVPGIYKELLYQLPALAPRHALVLGEAVNAPALVYMREANPIPQSKDPKFYKQWISESPKIPNVEKVCAKWEGKSENETTDMTNSSK